MYRDKQNGLAMQNKELWFCFVFPFSLWFKYSSKFNFFLPNKTSVNQSLEAK